MITGWFGVESPPPLLAVAVVVVEVAATPDAVGANELDEPPKAPFRKPFGELDPSRPGEPKLSGGSVAAAAEASADACDDGAGDGDGDCRCEGGRKWIVVVDCARP